MTHRTNPLFGATALACTLLLSAAPVMAGTAGSVKPRVPVSEAGAFYVQQLNESSDMMGQIALARQSLDLGMDDDAVYHLDHAQKLANELQAKTPELAVASTLRFNDKVYSFNNEYKDFLIPTVDDLFTVADFDAKIKRNPTKDKVSEKDAGIGRYQLALDIRNVQAALKSAKELTQKGDILEARLALNNVYKGAVENSIVYEDPIWTVHDNLMVANAMVKEKDYDGARFALKKAESELKTIESYDKYASDQPALKKLGEEVKALHATLRKDDPNILKKAGEKISAWLKDIRGIGDKHEAVKKTSTH
jgi:tetratricopeptide (TPR) repeat protein